MAGVRVIVKLAVSACLVYGSLSRPLEVSMNKVWPFANPTETYRYYDFPFCQPDEIMPQFMTFGQVLRGDRLVNSLYKMNFREEVERTLICNRTLRYDDITLLKAAIDESYMFEMFVTNLPVVRPFGLKSIEKFGNMNEAARERYFLVNFLDFVIGYNGDSVVSANVTVDLDLEHIVDITAVQDRDKGTIMVPFTYSVHWVESDVSPDKALEWQMKNAIGSMASQSMDIHWLAIINSFVLMLLIFSLLLLIIIRVVRSDLSKYLQIPDEELAAVEEETGWKLLHADIFRPPVHRLFFSAAVGAGSQMLTIVICMVLVGCLGSYYQRGGVVSAGVLLYMVTAAIAGYISARLYQNLGGEKWAWNIFVTGVLYPAPLFFTWATLNTVAIFYSSTAAFPFPTILLIIAMWACVTFPLTVLGGVLGRHQASKMTTAGAKKYSFPCKTNKLAREIPKSRWYQSPLVQFLATGFLPFSAIYIELHYIFHSVWGPKIYTLYGILLLAFVMLILVASTVTVLFTYFHLNAEDHRWWWRSFLSGAAISAFFMIYCVYFYAQTTMSGLLQSSFFFGYSLLVAYALALMVGAMCFASTYSFVWYIYSRIKAE